MVRFEKIVYTHGTAWNSVNLVHMNGLDKELLGMSLKNSPKRALGPSRNQHIQ